MTGGDGPKPDLRRSSDSKPLSWTERVEFGLYACLLPGLCYALLGTTDAVSIGPTAVMSLLTAEFAGGDPQLSVLLAFFTGVVVLTAGLVRLGFLVDFFSVPVVSGFVSAASITICSTQLKGLLGIKGSSGKTMIGTLRHVAGHIDETNLWDLLLGTTCILLLLGLRWLGQRAGSSGTSAGRRSPLATLQWLLSIARNALVVLLASLLVLALERHQLSPLSTTETVPVGFPAPQPPPFALLAVNGTREEAGLLQLTRQLGLGLLVVPLVSVIECMAIAKAFDVVIK
ncbi:sodium-independent sulfate anion transporter-like [Pollicipes pollicipes]|uniref:sodium-independent sulfate anion transporter-like n=1 Tax=Pollicipes pollicipes TaxID=41117 RepID=UPI0018850F3D|nr:sodium-independent sulfate anion transporter-like [Pollicipes pollicipes]